MAELKTRIEKAEASGCVRLFSLREEFPSEWAALVDPAAAQPSKCVVQLRAEHYPFWARERLKTVASLRLMARSSKATVPGSIELLKDGKKYTLVKDASQGNMLVGTGEDNIELLPTPVGELEIELNNPELTDLWFAVTWKE
jgi:hypothetical protein